MSLTRQRPPGVGPPSGEEPAYAVPARPLWQQFMIGAVVVLIIVGVILVVVRAWAIPALQARGGDSGISGEATLAALQTQRALTPRPTATSVVTPAVRPAAAATAASTPAPTRVPTPEPAVAPALAPTLQSTPQATVAPVVLPTSAPPGSQSTTGGGTDAPSANETPYPLPTPSLEVAKAVSEAYLRYWTAYGKAVGTLDTSGLGEVTAGDALTSITHDIDSDRAQDRALNLDVQHDFSVLTVINDQAVVADHFRDYSVYVDPVTRDPLPGQVTSSSPDATPESGVLYKLELIDGTWKVVQAQKLS